MEPLNIRIPSEDYRRLEQIANETGQTLSDIGREAIARYLGRSGAGARIRSRLDRLEKQVDRLTLMVTSQGDSRGELSARFVEMLNKLS